MNEEQRPVALIAALSDNGVIGRDNQLPWHLPEDLRHFKALTLGKPVVMGRRTFESIGRPLPGRSNIVVSANPRFRAEGVQVCRDLAAALSLADALAREQGADEIMVIGGAILYTEALSLARRLYLTRVHCRIDGDTFFPQWSAREWRRVGRERLEVSAERPFAVSFEVYERVG